MLSQRTRRRPMGPVLLATAAGVMVGLLFYGLLVTEPMNSGAPARLRGDSPQQDAVEDALEP